MAEAYLIEAVRTPVGRRNGGLKDVHPADLGAHVLKGLLDRAKVDPMAVDDVVWGCCDAIGPQAGDIGRTCWLAAGLPEEIPGVTIDRQCGSSQQAVHFAAQGVMSGTQDVVIAGGVQNMTMIPITSSMLAGEKIRSLQTLGPDGRTTAAMASRISDGATAVLVAGERAVKEHGLKPRARIHHMSVRAADPVYMLTAPINATAYALEKSGMSLDDIDLVEINEAFAPVVMAWLKETGCDPEKVNVNGGAIALGHPIGATGTRLMTTLINELERSGKRWGLQTMCEGGGQANVTIIERL